MISMTKVAACH